MSAQNSFLAELKKNGLVETLKPIAKADPDYKWLEPIVNDSLQARVFHSLETDPLPDLNALTARYSPLWYERNLLTIVELLEKSVDIRTQILALESQALASGLEFILSDQMAADTRLLTRTQLRATRNLFPADESDADEDTLNRINLVVSRASETRLRMHNESGSPLNYGERVRSLTDLMTANIRHVIELSSYVRSGLYYGERRKTQDIRWRPIGDGLLELLNWSRKEIEFISARRQQEKIYRRAVFLGGDRLIRGTKEDLRAALATSNGCDCQFTLFASDVLPRLERSRLLGIIVVPIFEDTVVAERAALIDIYDKNNDNVAVHRLNISTQRWMLERRRQASTQFNIELTPPVQAGIGEADPDIFIREWQPKSIDISPAGWVPGSGDSLIDAYVLDSSLMGISALGLWSAKLSGRSQADVDIYNTFEERNSSRGKLDDIAVILKYAAI